MSQEEGEKGLGEGSMEGGMGAWREEGMEGGREGAMEGEDMEGERHGGRGHGEAWREVCPYALIPSPPLPSSPYHSSPCPSLLPPHYSARACGVQMIRAIEVRQRKVELGKRLKLPGLKPTMRHRQMERGRGGGRNHWSL